MNYEKIFYYSGTNFLFVLRGIFDKKILKEKQRIILENQEMGDLGIFDDFIRLNPSWFDIWKDVNLPEELSEYNQLIYPPQIRKLISKECYVPFHQDWMYLSKDVIPEKFHERFCVCFLPLNNEPSKYPTVEFVNNSKQTKIAHKERFKTKFNSFYLDGEFENIENFNLDFGDALIFGNEVAHRTLAKDYHRWGRLSQEFRITDDKSRIVGKDYYNMFTNKFDIYL